MLKNADSTFFLKFYLRILFLEKILHCHHYFHLSLKKTLFKKFKNNKISIKTKMSKFETFVFIIACILAISIDSSESNLITNLINNIQRIKIEVIGENYKRPSRCFRKKIINQCK